MQVTSTLNEGLKRAYHVIVPNSIFKNTYNERLAYIGKTVKLSGFRPGKVPPSVLRQRFGESVDSEALEKTIHDAVEKLLKENDLSPVMAPDVKNISDVKKDQDIEFDVSFEVLPEITIPDISGVKLTKHVSKVTDDIINKALLEIASHNKKFEKSERNTASTEEDVVNINFCGKIDGVAFDGGTAEDVDVELNGKNFIPGFAQQIIGMKPGDEKQIKVTFPEDYGVKELAGKEAAFDIKVNYIAESIEAKLDDSLAKSLGMDSLDQIKKLLEEQTKREYDKLSRMRVKRDLLDVLAEKVDFPIPESMEHSEFHQIWGRFESERKAGNISDAEKNKSDDELKEEYHAIAARRVKLGLLLADIARKENIQVSPEELQKALQEIAVRYPGQEKQIYEYYTHNPQAIKELTSPILEEKVVDFLLKKVDLSEKEVSEEELSDLEKSE